MTNQQINAAIAKACGWIDVWRAPTASETAYFVGTSPSGEFLPVTNYCNDLNAMHEAEATILQNGPEFSDILLKIVNRAFDPDMQYPYGCFRHVHASARHRAEAFLRTLGKWEEVQW